jgi:hypothetical protein
MLALLKYKLRIFIFWVMQDHMQVYITRLRLEFYFKSGKKCIVRQYVHMMPKISGRFFKIWNVTRAIVTIAKVCATKLPVSSEIPDLCEIPDQA